MDAINDFNNQPQSFLYSLFVSQDITTNAINKSPCNPPTMVTAMGQSAMYFNGIAMNNKTKNETPSAKAIFLNKLNVFVDDIIDFFTRRSSPRPLFLLNRFGVNNSLPAPRSFLEFFSTHIAGFGAVVQNQLRGSHPVLFCT